MRACACLCDREGVFRKKTKKEQKKNGGGGGGGGKWDGKTVLKEESLSVFCARCEVVTTLADNRLSAISAEQHQWVFFKRVGGGGEAAQPYAVAAKVSRAVVK